MSIDQEMDEGIRRLELEKSIKIMEAIILSAVFDDSDEERETSREVLRERYRGKLLEVYSFGEDMMVRFEKGSTTYEIFPLSLKIPDEYAGIRNPKPHFFRL